METSVTKESGETQDLSQKTSTDQATSQSWSDEARTLFVSLGRGFAVCFTYVILLGLQSIALRAILDLSGWHESRLGPPMFVLNCILLFISTAYESTEVFILVYGFSVGGLFGIWLACAMFQYGTDLGHSWLQTIRQE